MVAFPGSVKWYIKRLNHKSWIIQGKAAQKLGEIGDIRAIEPLIEKLSTEVSCVQEATKQALTKLGATKEQMFQGYIKGLGSGCLYYVKALGKLGDKRAVEPLIKMLSHVDGHLRYNAAQALGKLGDKRAIEPLINALEDDWADFAAAEALIKLGDKRAVEPLIKRLSHQYPGNRENAATALGGSRDKRAVEPLIKMLSDQHKDCRKVAAIALGKLGDERAVEPLIEVLTDRYWDIRHEAEEALKKLGAPVNAIIDSQEQLCAAVESGDIETMKLLLKNGVSVKTICGGAETLLHIAVRRENIEMVRLLLENKAPVNDKDHNGMSPLHYAAMRCNKSIAELLLIHGADIDAVNNYRLTPLYSYRVPVWHRGLSQMSDKEIDMAMWLLEHGADPNPEVIASNGLTMLKSAIYNNHHHLVALIELYRAKSLELPTNRIVEKGAKAISVDISQPRESERGERSSSPTSEVEPWSHMPRIGKTYIEEQMPPIPRLERVRINQAKVVVFLTDIAQACMTGVPTFLMVEGKACCFFKTQSLPEQAEAQLIDSISQNKLTLTATFHGLPTYPIVALLLQALLGDHPARLEAVPDITVADVRDCLDFLLKTGVGTFYLFAEEPIRLLAKGQFSVSSIDNLRKCLNQAATHYKRIPPQKMDHRTAIEEYFRTTSF